MLTDLDRRFDETLAAVIAPGGRLVIGDDGQGRAIVDNFPATVPALLRTFCALNPDVEAMVCGEERLTFAELDRVSECVAHGLAARGIGKGDRVAIAMRNCPSWVVSYMGIVKAGAISGRTLSSSWSWSNSAIACSTGRSIATVNTAQAAQVAAMRFARGASAMISSGSDSSSAYSSSLDSHHPLSSVAIAPALTMPI